MGGALAVGPHVGTGLGKRRRLAGSEGDDTRSERQKSATVFRCFFLHEISKEGPIQLIYHVRGKFDEH